MLKWIKNSKKAPNSKTSNYKGIKLTAEGNYYARLAIRKEGRSFDVSIGTFKTEKEAVNARINFILGLL